MIWLLYTLRRCALLLAKVALAVALAVLAVTMMGLDACAALIGGV